MAKREDKVQVSEVADPGPNAVVTAADFDDIEIAGDNESVSIADVLAALASTDTGEVEDPAEWQASIVGSDYFWPASRGFVIRGKILSVEARKTNFMVDDPERPGAKRQLVARFYTFELTAPCVAIRSSDMKPGQPMPRPVQCNPGQHVAVLERTILRRLENDVGREVIVVCDGPGRTRAGLQLWKFRSWRRVVPVEVKQLDGSAPAPQLPAAG